MGSFVVIAQEKTYLWVLERICIVFVTPLLGVEIVSPNIEVLFFSENIYGKVI